jgi:hypothetical protein
LALSSLKRASQLNAVFAIYRHEAMVAMNDRFARSRSCVGIAAAALAASSACDAHTRVYGHVVGPDNVPMATAKVVFHGWTDHEVPVSADGSFEAWALHGGHAWLRVDADGVATGIKKVGTGVYDCSVRLMSVAPKNPWQFECKRRQSAQ